MDDFFIEMYYFVIPFVDAESYDGYPGMHKKDVEAAQRAEKKARVVVDADAMAKGKTAPFDLIGFEENGLSFKANKPIRMRVKDGRWALFFNGSQYLESNTSLSPVYRYNSPFTISAWVLSTKVGPVSTVVSLSASQADLATTQLRLGTEPSTGLVNHNGSFESCGSPEEVKAGEGKWQMWTVTFDGWMERVFCNGKLVREQNNFLMIRPEGKITIGADSNGTNNFRGYISRISIKPSSMTADEIRQAYETIKTADTPSLGDDFEEIDPDSKFTMSPSMKPIYEHRDTFTLAATTPDFNLNPLDNGGHIYKEVEGDFVVMATVDDIDGLAERKIKGWNDGGILVAADSTYYQLGAFPLYNCGNMFTILSPEGRPQFPNYTGYDFHRHLQIERRGNNIFARTSVDGKSWENMPGSPVEVSQSKVGIGVYQSTYSQNYSWIRLKDFVIYR